MDTLGVHQFLFLLLAQFGLQAICQAPPYFPLFVFELQTQLPRIFAGPKISSLQQGFKPPSDAPALVKTIQPPPIFHPPIIN